MGLPAKLTLGFIVVAGCFGIGKCDSDNSNDPVGQKWARGLGNSLCDIANGLTNVATDNEYDLMRCQDSKKEPEPQKY